MFEADDARGTLIGFFNAFFQAMVTLTSGIVRLLPIGVFALITRMVRRRDHRALGGRGRDRHRSAVAARSEGRTTSEVSTRPRRPRKPAGRGSAATAGRRRAREGAGAPRVMAQDTRRRDTQRE